MALDKVLIVADLTDAHALAVQRRLERRGVAEGVLLDSGQFPVEHKAAAVTGERPLTGRIGPVDLDELCGVWWRRPNPHEIPGWVSTAARQFCFDESRALFDGLLHGLGRLVVNPLREELAADYKPLQLAEAARAGLTVPDTLVTNDPERAKAFHAEHGGEVIFKILTNTRHHFAETRRLRAELLGELDRILVAPTIFQRIVPLGVDLRVTVVGERIFPARMVHDRPGTELDWRLDVTARPEACELPTEVEEGILRLMRSLGLVYGAIDFRLDPDGRYQFLEVNPSGQFLFVEIHAGHPICDAMAELLESRRGVVEGVPPRRDGLALAAGGALAS